MDEHAQAVHPIVQESVAHNAKTLNTIHSLSSPLLGIAAGTLHLESTWGFLFYTIGTLLVGLLLWVRLRASETASSSSLASPPSSSSTSATTAAPQRYFGSSASASAAAGGKGSGPVALKEMMLGGVGIESVMGFVMAWTLVYNYVGT
ncbi:MAG: hypothetical protein M1831_007439 [Alyxoria varia]|nr:MAG: hypothetical protein M1831_007439 [Alyxoria varia]